LWSLGSPILLAAGESKTFISAYVDPTSQSSKMTAYNQITPLATTDYLMNLNQTGTSTNLTAYLTVSASYSSSEVSYTLTNTYSYQAYVIKLQFRGYGIYSFNEQTIRKSDTTSITQNGIFELDLAMDYQTSSTSAESIANKILSQDKTAKANLNKVYFRANNSDLLIAGFLYLDIGDMIYLTEKSGFSGYYYIQSIDFSITPGHEIYFSWLLVPALSVGSEYWILGQSLLGQNTILT
jgi:hypothetical protein